MLSKVKIIVLASILVVSVIGCGFRLPGSGNGETGELIMKLTDAPVDKADHVYVTISRVEVNKDGGPWETFMEVDKQFDLLTLRGVSEILESKELPYGHYTGIRLFVSDATIVVNEEEHDMTIPSADQTGIKLNYTFDITPGGVTILLLDYDARQSVIYAPGQGYIMKPTIRVMEYLSAGQVQGVVFPEDSSALVTIRDLEEEIVVEGLIDSEDGSFVFGALEEGTYTYGITADGYEVVGPEEFVIVAQEITDLDIIELVPLKVTGTIIPADSGAVIKIYDEEDQEVANATIHEDGGFLFEGLPSGTYKYVVEAEGFEDLGPEAFEIAGEGVTDLGEITLTVKEDWEEGDE